MLAVLHVDDVWQPDREAEAREVFGTTNPEHPGVAYLLDRSNPLAGIADSSITCPPVDFELLETYFSYFIKTHFLEAPKRALRPIPS